jgi:FAD/FMN-containing dehydrogenase
MSISPGILDRFKAAAGPGGWTDDGDRIAPHLVEWRERFRGHTPLMLTPGDTATVARLVRLAHETRTPLVPQGGNTGLVGGQIPDGQILIWLGRMNRLRMLDAANDAVTVEAGAILANVQQLAADADRLFPLSLASEGSAQIGGLISTNAGGTAVLAYGNMRDLVLGLEVVMPDGSLFEGLQGLRKDNTGYDLVRLFCGSEGTLGIVTAATLKLFPRPRATECAIAGVANVQDAIALLGLAKDRAGGMLTGFEIMPRIGIDFVTRHMPASRDPLAAAHPWYVLVETSLTHAAQTGLLSVILEAGAEGGLVLDAVVAQSDAQARDFWRLREGLSEAQKFEGGSIKHDVSVPVSAMARFIAEATDATLAIVPGARPVPFGHVGDGNVHFNVSQPVAEDKAAFLARWQDVSDAVHSVAHRLGGSISAEHGIGRMKAQEIQRYKSPAALAAMRAIKQALDPHGIMNPGAVLAPGPRLNA